MTGTPFDDDKLHEECGVFGVYGHEDAAALTALGLHALQHRGQEACGIVTYDGKNYYSKRAFGLVDDTFSSAEVISTLKGHVAIGHNRYSTTGEPMFRNIQPLYADMSHGGFAVAHNGNLTNAFMIRQNLVKRGSLFQSTSDTEVIVHLVAVSREERVSEKLIDAVKQIKGAYAILAQSEGRLMGIRDPYGIRPLVLGRLGDAYVLASESCALDIIGATLEREIKPGEMVIIDQNGLRSLFPFEERQKRFCIFEYIYFARPDSFMEGRSVYEMRKHIGAQLAREAPCPNADIVVPVPDSGVPSAIGFAEESKLPFELGIIRNHYIGRTFIEPSDQIRHLGVKLKHNANRAYINGKSVVLVDDSIVRGTTSRKIVEMVRSAGAKEVHMRISSPPTTHSCFYGIDTPDKEELLAHKKSIEEIKDYIGADSLSYISIDGLYRAVGEAQRNGDAPQFCDACFTGDYPVDLVDHANNMTGVSMTGLSNGDGKLRAK
ncbi:MAG: amidophosphoribosyltransferase [Alphaproteobacteria bacterium]|nr:amidophosphoribosyltransferase [Alphaproteobacteria bacterium]